MQIRQTDDNKHGSFIMFDNDVQIAEMAYTWAGEQLLIIDHTDVDEKYKGQGLGRKLLDELVAFVRAKNVKVIPLCPFSKSVFDKDASIRDVLRP